MAELKREDIIEDAALQAPLILAANLEQAYMVITKIAKASKEAGIAVEAAGNIRSLTDETTKLVAEQNELVKIQKQIATVTAKNNDEYIKQTKALNDAKKALKDKIALGDAETKDINKKNSSLKTLEAALAKNKDAYRNLANEEARAGKEGKELLKIIQQQAEATRKANEAQGDFTDNVGKLWKAQQAFAKIAPGVRARRRAVFGKWLKRRSLSLLRLSG